MELDKIVFFFITREPSGNKKSHYQLGQKPQGPEICQVIWHQKKNVSLCLFSIRVQFLDTSLFGSYLIGLKDINQHSCFHVMFQTANTQ